MVALDDDALSTLLQAAVAAPSADNHHGWRWQCTGRRLRLFAAPEPVPATSVRRTLFLISLGATVENLVLRARRIGLRAQVEWSDRLDAAAALVELEFEPAEVVEDALEVAIEHRHSNRHIVFRGPRLAAQQLQALQDEAGATPGAAVHWLDEQAVRSRAVAAIRRAETQRFVVPALHRELYEAVRFDVGWHASCDLGLPPGSLGLSAPERPGFAMLRHWPLQRVANVLGVQYLMAWRGAGLPCRWAPHLCVIAAEGDLPHAAVAAGRLVQRVWLRASALDLAVQVFAASPLYAIAGISPLPPPLQQRLADDWSALCPRGTPFIVMRLGHAPAPLVRSGRPDPSSLKC